MTGDPPSVPPEELLSRIALFADLGRVELAKLVPQLELLGSARGR